MSNKEQIEFMVKRLKQINSKLGEDGKPPLPPFDAALLSFQQAMFNYRTTRKFIAANSNSNSVQLIRAKATLQQAKSELSDRLAEMGRLVEEGERKGPDPFEMRQKLKQSRQAYEMLMSLEEQPEAGGREGFTRQVELDNLQDLKRRHKEKEDSQQNFMDGDDAEIILEFQNKDREIDARLDQLIQGIDSMQVKNQRFKEGMQLISQREARLQKKVVKTSANLERKNAQLKELLEHFGKGTNCCMTLCLLLLLAGLIVVLINLALKLKK